MNFRYKQKQTRKGKLYNATFAITISCWFVSSIFLSLVIWYLQNIGYLVGIVKSFCFACCLSFYRPSLVTTSKPKLSLIKAFPFLSPYKSFLKFSILDGDVPNINKRKHKMLKTRYSDWMSIVPNSFFCPLSLALYCFCKPY